MKELRQILMNIDFIRNNDCNLKKEDLNEMVKFARVIEIPPLSKIFKEGDDADTLYFVAQGSLVTTYTLTEKDHKAVFFGKKD